MWFPTGSLWGLLRVPYIYIIYRTFTEVLRTFTEFSPTFTEVLPRFTKQREMAKGSGQGSQVDLKLGTSGHGLGWEKIHKDRLQKEEKWREMEER